MRDLGDRVVVVTGANSGVGRETTRALARRGARVLLGCRDLGRAEEARRDVLGSVPEADLEVLRVDLASLDDVRRFAAEVRRRHDAVHVLVNNAGFHTATRALTVDGLESTFAVNHLAHFVLTEELRPALERGAPSRVVTVASEAHRYFGALDLDDPMGERRWSGIKAYCQSKLANVMFTYDLARRLAGTGVAANAVHPGSVRTNWARRGSGALGVAALLARPFLVSAERGARTSVRVAADADLAGATGSYFVRGRAVRSSRASYDVAAQVRLRELSAALAGGGRRPPRTPPAP